MLDPGKPGTPIAAAQLLCDLLLEQHEPHPVKAADPVRRAQPEIALRGLRDGGDGAAGQALLRLPVLHRVAGRSRRVRGRAESRRRSQVQHPEERRSADCYKRGIHGGGSSPRALQLRNSKPRGRGLPWRGSALAAAHPCP